MIEHDAFKPLLKTLNRIEVKDTDYFKTNMFCYLGTKYEYDYYIENEEFPTLTYNRHEIRGWEINPTVHLNLDMIASAGAGKTKLLKNIVSQYHRQGWRILIISSKENEFSITKQPKQSSYGLHPLTSPTYLPMSSYCPAYIKHWRIKNKYSNAGYKFFSPSFKDMEDISVWKSFGMTSDMAGFCASQVKKRGITKLKELKNIVEKSQLFKGQKQSFNNKIDAIVDNKYIDEKIEPLDLEHEWGWTIYDKGVPSSQRYNNVVSINFFQHSEEGFLPNTVWQVLVNAKDTIQKARSRGFTERVLVVLDDAYLYANKGDETHKKCIDMIIQLKTTLRKAGIDTICAYQFLNLIDLKITQSTKEFLISYVPDKNSLSGFIPPDALDHLKWDLVYDEPYNVQWLHIYGNLNWKPFFPNNCVLRHDFS